MYGRYAHLFAAAKGNKAGPPFTKVDAGKAERILKLHPA